MSRNVIEHTDTPWQPKPTGFLPAKDPLTAADPVLAPVPTLGFGAPAPAAAASFGTSAIAHGGKPPAPAPTLAPSPFDVSDVDVRTPASSVAPPPPPPAASEAREPGFAEDPALGSPGKYPTDPQGFLNGLVEGLTHVSSKRPHENPQLQR